MPHITKTFILAGDATFTIETPDGHRTYRVQHAPASERWAESWFVKLLTGSDNETSYTYVGKLDEYTGQVSMTTKSKLGSDSVPVRLFNRTMARVWADDHDAYERHGYKTHHEGKCGRCGRKLTVPASVESGIGPECSKIMGAERTTPLEPVDADFTAAIQAQDRADEEARCEYKMRRDGDLFDPEFQSTARTF